MNNRYYYVDERFSTLVHVDGLARLFIFSVTLYFQVIKTSYFRDQRYESAHD